MSRLTSVAKPFTMARLASVTAGPRSFRALRSLSAASCARPWSLASNAAAEIEQPQLGKPLDPLDPAVGDVHVQEGEAGQKGKVFEVLQAVVAEVHRALQFQRSQLLQGGQPGEALVVQLRQSCRANSVRPVIEQGGRCRPG